MWSSLLKRTRQAEGTLLIGLCMSPVRDSEFPTGPSRKHGVLNEIWTEGPNFMSNLYSHIIVDVINILIFGYHYSSS